MKHKQQIDKITKERNMNKKSLDKLIKKNENLRAGGVLLRHTPVFFYYFGQFNYL